MHTAGRAPIHWRFPVFLLSGRPRKKLRIRVLNVDFIRCTCNKHNTWDALEYTRSQSAAGNCGGLPDAAARVLCGRIQGLNFNRNRSLSIVTCSYDTVAQRCRSVRLFRRSARSQEFEVLANLHPLTFYMIVKCLATMVQCKALIFVNVPYITVFTTACYRSFL
jgi:hypothetical protein